MFPESIQKASLAPLGWRNCSPLSLSLGRFFWGELRCRYILALQAVIDNSFLLSFIRRNRGFPATKSANVWMIRASSEFYIWTLAGWCWSWAQLSHTDRWDSTRTPKRCWAESTPTVRNKPGDSLKTQLFPGKAALESLLEPEGCQQPQHRSLQTRMGELMPSAAM